MFKIRKIEKIEENIWGINENFIVTIDPLTLKMSAEYNQVEYTKREALLVLKKFAIVLGKALKEIKNG